MAKVKFLFIIILLVPFAQSCTQGEDDPNFLEFYWDQTGCADPWESENSEAEIRLTLVNYLENQGVKGARVTDFTFDGREAICLACSCTTGVRIFVEAPKSSKSKMLELGFKEVN